MAAAAAMALPVAMALRPSQTSRTTASCPSSSSFSSPSSASSPFFEGKALILRGSCRGRSSPPPPAVALLGGLFKRQGASSLEARESKKRELLQRIETLARGADADEQDVQEVDELARGLEKLNPNKKALKSPLLNGKWQLLYTTSASILGTKRFVLLRPVGPIYQTIDARTLRALNQETWPFFNQVTADLTPTSDSAVAVKFDVFKIFGLISFKAPDGARGSLDITYVDEDLRISRGDKGNLFILDMVDADATLPKS